MQEHRRSPRRDAVVAVEVRDDARERRQVISGHAARRAHLGHRFSAVPAPQRREQQPQQAERGGRQRLGRHHQAASEVGEGLGAAVGAEAAGDGARRAAPEGLGRRDPRRVVGRL